jgi:hypothetical protein
MVRNKMLSKIKLGLVPFLLKTPYGEKLDLSITEDLLGNGFDESDPWKNWMFEIYGTGTYTSQKTYRDLSLSGSIYASKITEKIKIESGNSIGYSSTDLSYYSGDSVMFSMKSKQKYLSSMNLFVRSLGNHCGIGGTAVFRKSDYSNLDFQVVTGPAFEVNLFEYSEASRRQFRFLYSISYEHSDYSDTTICNKLRDDLFRQQLDIIFTYLDEWGTISVSACGTNYLSNLSQYAIGATAAASIRLFKGVSFTLSGNCSYYQNQISLKKDPGDLEDFLTGQTELEKGLSYNLVIGLSYRFGSINNNAVNPRFER